MNFGCKMETKIINKSDLGCYLEQLPHHPVVGMLFTGDRISCIGFAVVIEYGDKLAGLATGLINYSIGKKLNIIHPYIYAGECFFLSVQRLK